ncbi:MAG: multidrug effflux MFS transporter [Alphaproteobacteria bacterium]|nr:multidrug effflux MFS transporter [Alphaproteobacteria bacterium]
MLKAFLPLAILSLVACCIEVDISVPGFPDMAHYFKVSDGIIQLTLAYNFLGFCCASFIYGPLSECYGRRKVMVWGNFLLFIGAFGCVYAPTISFLLISRFIQGVGAATSAVVAFAMVADVYQKHKAVKVISIMNSLLTTLMAVAPVAGTFINQMVGWRGNYGFIALICFVSWTLLWLFLPETKQEREIFKVKSILNDYRTLLTNSKFINASLLPSLLYATYLSFIACASFLYIETFGMSLAAYALHQATIVSCFSIVSLFVEKISVKIGEKNCIKSGTIICMIGSLALVTLCVISPYSPYVTTSCMIVFCIGFSIVYPIVFTASLEIFPELKGTASSAIMGMRTFLCSSIIGLVSYLYDGKPLTVALAVFSIVCIASIFSVRVCNQFNSKP